MSAQHEVRIDEGLAEKSSWDNLGIHQTIINSYSQFPDTFVKFVLHLGTKETFIHCSQKRPMP